MNRDTDSNVSPVSKRDKIRRRECIRESTGTRKYWKGRNVCYLRAGDCNSENEFKWESGQISDSLVNLLLHPF